ncbi:MAG: VWA domain-containing protein [Chitinophagaceae bacterium]|nr:VWA domain-containing protein [Oligoflexus sp.]
MSLEYPWVLLLLALIPLLYMWRSRDEQKRAGFGFPSIASFRTYSWSGRWQRHMPSILRSVALICLAIAAARPLGGDVRAKKHSEGLDIMLVLDTSQSMLAMDFEIKKERQNRLEVVKHVVEEFINGRPDDRMGVVVFGAEAFTQAPLTMDHKVLLQFLKHVTVGMAGPDTAIGDGLGTAIKRLKDVPAPSKIVILLTDGDSNAGSLDPMEAAQLAKTLGIRVYTIAVGSNKPVPFPVQGLWGMEYRPQLIRMNTELLVKMSELTGAQSFMASTTEGLSEIYKTIDHLEKSKQEWEDPIEREEMAWVFLLASLGCVLIEQLWLLSRWRVIP